MKLNVKNKKTIIAAAVLIVVIAVTITLILVLGGGAKKEKLSDYYAQSMTTVKKVTEVSEIKSGDTQVYGKTAVLTFKSGDNAEIVTTEKKLNDYKMDFETDTVTEEGEIDRSGLVVISFDLSVFESDYTFKKGEFTGKVKAENIGKLFAGSAPQTEGDVTVKAKFTGKKIASVNYEYTTKTDRTVSVAIEYDYNA